MDAKSADTARVLVVEDEYFIADDCAKVLTDLGCQVAGPFCRLDEAIRFLDEGRELIAGALLDVNLQGHAVYPLLEKLIEMKIPIALYTGYAADYLPERFRDIPIFTKPEPACQAAEYICNLARLGC